MSPAAERRVRRVSSLADAIASSGMVGGRKVRPGMSTRVAIPPQRWQTAAGDAISPLVDCAARLPCGAPRATWAPHEQLSGADGRIFRAACRWLVGTGPIARAVGRAWKCCANARPRLLQTRGLCPSPSPRRGLAPAEAAPHWKLRLTAAFGIWMRVRRGCSSGTRGAAGAAALCDSLGDEKARCSTGHLLGSCLRRILALSADIESFVRRYEVETFQAHTASFCKTSTRGH